MTAVVELEVGEVTPPRAAVHRGLGLPERVEPSPAVAALLDEEWRRYAELVAPRAALRAVVAADFAAVYLGDGHNAPASPLDAIYPRAERLVLFAATLGRPVCDAVADLADGNEPARAYLLDAIASAGADQAVRSLEARCRRDVAAADVRVLAYSPGYCGWHVSGQRALFAALRPEAAGIALTASCLMLPIKSVSGVLVAAAAEVHRFSADFPSCAECAADECRARFASLEAQVPPP
jgi:hypothetical protein